MIRIENLNKYYNKGKSNELHVINNTTVTLPDTGLICILGESGSGKTTLMNTVSGLDDFSDGIIEVDGTRIKEYGDKNQERVRNEKFGYIFQNYYLLMDRTVEYNIMLALSMYHISGEEKERRIDYVLRAVDMWRYKKRPVSDLSGGQQQRVAIARALAKSPRVIFADEPTGNLDEANTMNVMGILKKISKECLVVVVTHEKAIAEFFADKILWITDGRIEKELDRERRSVYQYVDDNNIYLQEFTKRELKNGNVELEIYDTGENQNIIIQVVCDNGKLYVSAGDTGNVEFLAEDNERKVIDSKRPVVEMKDVDDIAFELEPVDVAKKPKLGFREVVSAARSNRKTLGIKQIFLAVTLFLMSVMIVLSVQEILPIVLVDSEDIVNKDSHYYKVQAQAARDLKTEVASQNFQKQMGIMTESLMEEGFEVYAIPQTTLTYEYEGFAQMENYNFEIEEYCFVPVDKMGEDTLLYGTMPSNETEVVLDKLVVEKFFKSSGQISALITDIGQMIGNTISTEQGIDLTITGISETGEPDIYVHRDLILMLCRTNFTFITESTVQEKYPDFQNSGLDITEDGKVEVLVSRERLKEAYAEYLNENYGEVASKKSYIRMYEDELEHSYIDEESRQYMQEELDKLQAELKELEGTLGITLEEYIELMNSETAYLDYTYEGLLTGNVVYSVAGYFDVDEEVDFIVPDESVPYFEKAIIDYYQSCYVYTGAEDAEIMEKKIKDTIPEAAREYLQIKVVNEAEEAIREYKKESSEKFNSRILVTVTIFLISMIILYFMMKVNAITRMQDLGVYRMLGISKGNIVGMFACENFIITSYTSVAGVLLMTFLTFGISRIESLEMSVIYPWYAVVLTILFFYASNILVGIMPVCRMLRLPPAQLAAKYDI